MTARRRERPPAPAADHRAILAALAGLEPEHIRVLIELHYRGSPAAAAAARLGIPEATVRDRAYQALRELGAALQARGAAVPRAAGPHPPRDSTPAG